MSNSSLPEIATDTTAGGPLLQVPEADLADLRSRLRATRWATPWPVEPWQVGTDGADLRRLVARWADGYDWRAHEAQINALPSHVAEIEGTRVHYLRFDAEPGAGPDPLPLVLTNGWPSTSYELVGLAQRLSQPSRFGGDPRDAFTVVVPSLPGFPFSGQRPTLDALPTHELWHRLLHDELGFTLYGAHGGDLGAGITGWLAQAHPESVVGVHLLDVDRTPRAGDTDLSAEERAYLDAVADWEDREGAYAHQHSTRPLTLAQGLSDSPSGLLAWILEKYRAWSDCDGDVTGHFGDDFLLTQASLYWFSGTISTSLRPYYERRHGLTPTLERVRVPTAVAWFPADLGARPPESWVRRRYDLARFTPMPRGGHFAAVEEPELLAGDITAFFGPLARTAPTG
ncbi:epoxide hydrolase family protein [Kineococcus rhizosphaerae]|uniref:epoxide hydrolase family protein n=1 Tax=Kineococcus rhizosphaerae TaxID=559628 RepID=UPI001FE75F25|nr:epoxide hydrolase family protein [Kineococcus rhizosphaerae]